MFSFYINDPPTTGIYPLSLPDVFTTIVYEVSRISTHSHYPADEITPLATGFCGADVQRRTLADRTI